MHAKALKMVAIITALAALSACGAGLSGASTGPDEVAVAPARPLQMPASLAVLPEPTPGGTNLADPTLQAEGAAPGARVPASDAALVTYAARYGVPADIRAQLAAADNARRGRPRLSFLQGLFGGNRYSSLYRGQALDPYAELQRLRAAGVATPTAPLQ